MSDKRKRPLIWPTPEEDAAITAAAESDPDNPPLTEEEMREMRPFSTLFPGLGRGRGPQKAPTKIPVTIRLDPDVLEHFKTEGAGWQTRINAALRRAAGLDR